MYDVFMEKIFAILPYVDIGWYLSAVFGASIFIRVVHAVLRAWKMHHEQEVIGRISFWKFVGRNISGIHPIKRKENGEIASPRWSDYWYTFILGSLEILAYPILLVTGNWGAVGAWIGFKALAQWKVWPTDRAVFNLFLIGNGLNVLASVVLSFVFFNGYSEKLYLANFCRDHSGKVELGDWHIKCKKADGVN